MKTLIFSDTHLSLPFEEKKYNFMRGIIEPADRVIINGDFWEGHLINFEQFIQSPWKNLFPLLKQKKTIYIYGNHDEELMTDKRVKLFSDEQFDRYEIQLKRKRLIVEHGDRFAYLPQLNPFMTKRSNTIEKIMTRKVGNRLHKIVGGRLNRKIKAALKSELKENDVYICGHTHFAEIDKNSNFINSGILQHGLGQYLVVDNNRITAKEEWYD